MQTSQINVCSTARKKFGQCSIRANRKDGELLKLTIDVRARNSKFQELYQTLQALIPMIRKEKGCLDCHIYQDMEDEEALSLCFHWKSLADLEKYMQTNSAGALLGAIDMLAETSKICFEPNSPLEGLDSLKRMRKKT